MRSITLCGGGDAACRYRYCSNSWSLADYDLDDGSSLPHPVMTHPVMGATTPFQQLVGSFGPGPGEVDDETVVSLDEPPSFHRGGRDGLDVQKPVPHQTRSSSHLLFAPPQRLNAPA